MFSNRSNAIMTPSWSDAAISLEDDNGSLHCHCLRSPGAGRILMDILSRCHIRAELLVGQQERECVEPVLTLSAADGKRGIPGLHLSERMCQSQEHLRP